MENVQFVTCNETTCPFNVNRECRSPILMIDEKGFCSIRDKGPYDNKSATQNYVDIRECRYKLCNHWEEDDLTKIGQCGLKEQLHFERRENGLVKDGKKQADAKCSTFEKQVDQPQNFQTVMPNE